MVRRPKIQPVVWSPPIAIARSRADAPLPPPDLLPVPATGPEDVAVRADGQIFTGVLDGRILRLDEGGGVDVVADTGGRPLGIEIDDAGDLIVCDAHRGLLRVDPAGGRIETLVAGVPLCNNAAIAADGTIYFSDSSHRFPLEHWRADLMEHSGTGRLLRRDPDGTVEVLLAGLQFANGVALAADESFVAVAETGSYRVTRYWLAGPDAGRSDALIDNLPGFPDNLSTGAGGLIWIALASPRNRLLDWAHPRRPALRKAVWALPQRLQPQPDRICWVMAVDATGRVVRDLRGPGDRYHMVTGVREHAGRLYLGSLVEHAVAVAPIPAPPG